jgi:hypothetical protein
MKKSARILWWSVGSFVLLGLIAVFYRNFTELHVDEQPFNSSTWKAKRELIFTSHDPGCVRGDMALNLMRSYLLISKTEADILGLLGQPDTVELRALSYQLGQCHWDGQESSLVIRFDEMGRAIKVTATGTSWR